MSSRFWGTSAKQRKDAEGADSGAIGVPEDAAMRRVLVVQKPTAHRRVAR